MPPTPSLNFASALQVNPLEVQSHELHISAVITCDCGSKKPFVVPALITKGLDVPRPCPDCGQQYVVQSVTYSNNAGEIAVTSTIAKIGGPTKKRERSSVEIRHLTGES